MWYPLIKVIGNYSVCGLSLENQRIKIFTLYDAKQKSRVRKTLDEVLRSKHESDQEVWTGIKWMPYLAGSVVILHLLLLHKQKCVLFWHLFRVCVWSEKASGNWNNPIHPVIKTRAERPCILFNRSSLATVICALVPCPVCSSSNSISTASLGSVLCSLTPWVIGMFSYMWQWTS